MENMYNFQRHIFFGAILALAALSSGCSKFAFKKILPSEAGLRSSANWPLAGGGADRVSQRDHGLALPLVQRLRLKMTSALGQNLVVSDGILYAPTLDGRLAAINLAKRRIQVRKKLPQTSEAACAVVDSSLLIAQRFGDKTLRHYNIRNGRLLWQIDGGDISTEPILSDSMIFCAALYKHVDAYRRSDGRRLWQYRTASQLHASPALADGVLVVGLEDGMLLALEARTGAKRWELDTGKKKNDGLAKTPFAGGIYATPVIRRQTVYVGTLDQEFFAVDLFAGAERWRLPVGSKVIHAAAANDSLVIFGANDGRIRAVDAASGAVQWEFRAGSVIGTSPIITGAQVFVGSLDHTLYCLDSRDGALLWRQTLEGRIRTNPIVWENYLIAGCEDNLLYIFEAANIHESF
jgi:outer membrane protein assembly factor BamB